MLPVRLLFGNDVVATVKLDLMSISRQLPQPEAAVPIQWVPPQWVTIWAISCAKRAFPLESEERWKLLAREVVRALTIKAWVGEANYFKLSLPPRMDSVWHEMVLFTAEYALLCKQVFGGCFVHHNPATAVDAIEVKNARVGNLVSLFHAKGFEEPDGSDLAWCWCREDEMGSEPPTKKRSQEPSDLLVTFKSLSNKTCSFRIFNWLPLKVVQDLLAERGMGSDRVRLIRAGSQIHDLTTVTDGDTIHLVDALRGC